MVNYSKFLLEHLENLFIVCDSQKHEDTKDKFFYEHKNHERLNEEKNC